MMLVGDISPWLKFWNKGVDITATIAANTLTAAIALLGWKVKLWMDEQSQLQTARINDRLAAEKSAKARQDRVLNMRRTLEGFTQTLETVKSIDTARKFSHDYLAWLDQTRLVGWKRNRDIVHRWDTLPFSTQSPGGLPGSMILNNKAIEALQSDLRNTAIPDSTDADFEW